MALNREKTVIASDNYIKINVCRLLGSDPVGSVVNVVRLKKL